MWKASRRLENFVVGLCDVVDGLVKVISLGFFGTNLSYSLICWFTDRRYREAESYLVMKRK